MISISKDFLVGVWIHKEWKCELSMFNFLIIEWPNSKKAYGSWVLRNNEVILTYVFEGKNDKLLYIFSIDEVIDENTIKTKDVERNKEEIMKRKLQ